MVLADSHRISRVPCYLGYFPSGSNISTTGFAPSMTGRSRPFVYATCLLLKVGRPSGKSHNPKHATPAGYHTCLVWPLPRSLATTNGITVVFSSCGYWDVSLPHVPFQRSMYSNVDNLDLSKLGFPIRKSPDQSLIADSPRLFAGFYVLLRLLMPRHSPYALNNLIPKSIKKTIY